MRSSPSPSRTRSSGSSIRRASSDARCWPGCATFARRSEVPARRRAWPPWRWTWRDGPRMTGARAETATGHRAHRERRMRERRIAWLVRAGVWLVRILGATWRIRVRYDDDVRRLRAAGQPIVFTLWHGELLPLLYHQ